MTNKLVTGLKSGSEIAFRECVETHQEKVRNTCFHFVHNIGDAEDLAQEVFIEVFRSIRHFKEDAQLSTWIYRIAVNKSLDFLRRKKRKKRFAQFTSLFGATADHEEIIIPAEGNPQQELEDKERRQILNWAISKLPENQQIAITLSKYEGFSNKEIASIMDLSLSAIEALIHRAKKNLQKQLHIYFEKKV